MKLSKYLCLSLLLASQILSCQKCEKDYIEIPPKYEFVEKLTLAPYKKTYLLNDTIWVQFQPANKSLFDKLSNSQVFLDTSVLVSFFKYRKVFPMPTQSDTFCNYFADSRLNPSFNTLSSSNLENTISIITTCNNPFDFKIGIIPKKTGIYLLEPGFAVRDCPNRLPNYYHKAKFIFDLADCNKDVWLTIPAETRLKLTPYYLETSIERKEIFAFKVE